MTGKADEDVKGDKQSVEVRCEDRVSLVLGVRDMKEVGFGRGIDEEAAFGDCSCGGGTGHRDVRGGNMCWDDKGDMTGDVTANGAAATGVLEASTGKRRPRIPPATAMGTVREEESDCGRRASGCSKTVALPDKWKEGGRGLVPPTAAGDTSI